jgi:hypothetical protein
MRSDGGTAISVFQADSDPQARTELAAGFYVPHAIVSGLISAKRFNELDAGGSLVTDSLTRYAMTVDVFKKNVPYTALLSLGYELRSKHYAASNSTDSLGAVVLGIDSTAQLSRAFKLMGGISTGAYVFGLDALKGRGPLNSSFLFSAALGMSVDTAALRFSPKPPVEKAEEKAAQTPDGKTPTDAKAAPEEKPALDSDSQTAAPHEAEASAAEAPAKPAFSRIAVEAGAGLYYNNKITIPGNLAFVAAIFNLRAGAWGSFGYRVTHDITIGGEIGFDYLTLSSSGIDMTLFDAPILATASYKLGGIGFEAFAGAFINGIAVTSSGLIPFVDLDAGARLRLGGLYAEASYVIGVGSTTVSIAGISAVASYPRFGLGYSLSFIK